MQEHTVFIDDVPVHVKVAGEGLSGSGKPLLLFHGWGSCADQWKDIAEQLAAEGYRVIVPDLPGFGKTPPPATVWTVSDYTICMRKLADRFKLSEFCLAGHSFGGAVAMQFALSYPERVERLILIAPAVIRKKSGIREHLLRFASKILWVLLYFAPSNVKVNVRNIGYRLIRRRDYLATYGIMREIFRGVIRENLEHKLPDIQARTLLLWGTKDTMTPLKDGHTMKKSMPNAELQVFENKTHALHIQIPDRIVSAILSFLRS